MHTVSKQNQKYPRGKGLSLRIIRRKNKAVWVLALKFLVKKKRVG